MTTPSSDTPPDQTLEDLLFAWLYAHRDASMGLIPAESVTAPYQAIESAFSKLREENQALAEELSEHAEDLDASARESARRMELADYWRGRFDQEVLENRTLRSSSAALEAENKVLRAWVSP